MKDNARHVPDSIRSCAPLCLDSPRLLRAFKPLPKNPYKTRTKCAQISQCKFLICSSPTTYNFNRVKCTHFPRYGASPLPRGEGQGVGQTGNPLAPIRPTKFRHPRDQSHFVPFLPLLPFSSSPANQLQPLYRTVQNGTNYKCSKNQPRCTNHLRRHHLRSSHFAEQCGSSPQSKIENQKS